jgi:hypothetical protein
MPVESPPAKRQCINNEPAVPEPTSEALKEIRTALRKIRSHICKPAKFSKAAALFRELLDKGRITHHVAVEAFQVQP